MDKKLIQQLNSSDPARRIAAIKALAKTRDEAALKYLATVYKTDDDPRVREMAIKAGKYIRQQAAPAPARSQPTSTYDEDEVYGYDSLYSTGDDLRSGVDDSSAEDDKIEISELDKERARGMVEQAVDLHMRNEDDKAIQMLEKALIVNPDLQHDSYTVKMASTLMGVSGEEALHRLEAAIEKGKSRHRKRSRSATASSPAHTTLAVMLLFGVIVMLIGYLVMPWLDINSLPTLNEQGEEVTLGEMIAESREQFEALEGAGASPEANELLAAFDSLKFNFTGLESAMISTGQWNVLEVMGFGEFLGEMDGMEIMVEPEPLDWSLLAVPIVGAVMVLIALGLLLTRSSSLLLWGLGLLLCAVLIVPYVYFYADAAGQVFGEGDNLDLAAFGTVTEFSGTQLIGLGFWVSVAGMVMILLMPMIAFLLPGPEEQGGKRKVAT